MFFWGCADVLWDCNFIIMMPQKLASVVLASPDVDISGNKSNGAIPRNRRGSLAGANKSGFWQRSTSVSKMAQTSLSIYQHRAPSSILHFPATYARKLVDGQLVLSMSLL